MIVITVFILFLISIAECDTRNLNWKRTLFKGEAKCNTTISESNIVSDATNYPFHLYKLHMNERSGCGIGFHVNFSISMGYIFNFKGELINKSNMIVANEHTGNSTYYIQIEALKEYKFEILCDTKCINRRYLQSDDSYSSSSDDSNGNEETKTTTAAATTTAQSTTAPTQSTTAPTQSTTAPTQSTTAPTQSTTAPTQSTTAPTQSTTAPTQSTTAPTQSTTAPTQSTTAPTQSTTAPTQSTTAPTQSTTAPTQSTTAPTAAPTQSTTAPTQSTTAPTAAPTQSTTAPTTCTIDTPLQANHDDANTLINTAVTIDVLNNDTGDGIEIESVTSPNSGVATITDGGTKITYTLGPWRCTIVPGESPDDFPPDSFSYTIHDQCGNIASATVDVTVYCF